MTASPLEGPDNATWVCFQRTLVVRDIFTGGKRTFFSQADAQDFRRRIYARNGEFTEIMALRPSGLKIPVNQNMALWSMH